MPPTERPLYIVRHAIAAERGDKWPDDAKRPLTPEGASRMRDAVRGLAVLDAEIDIVCTSPLVRAIETAEILVRGLNPKPQMVSLPALAPGGAPARIAEALAAQTPKRGLAVVGHEPDLGELAAWLIGARQPIPLKKGAVVRIDFAEWPPAKQQGRLVWAATPKMLRSLD
jgi:phosphohistidine phosphatase